MATYILVSFLCFSQVLLSMAQLILDLHDNLQNETGFALNSLNEVLCTTKSLSLVISTWYHPAFTPAPFVEKQVRIG